MRILGISIAQCYIEMPQTNSIWKKSGFHLPPWLLGRQPFVIPDSINNQKSPIRTLCALTIERISYNDLEVAHLHSKKIFVEPCLQLQLDSSFQEVSECWIPQQELMIAWTFKRWYNGLLAHYRWTFDQKLQCFFNCGLDFQVGIYVSEWKEQAKFLVFYQRQDLHLCWLWGPCMLHIAFLYSFF